MVYPPPSKWTRTWIGDINTPPPPPGAKSSVSVDIDYMLDTLDAMEADAARVTCNMQIELAKFDILCLWKEGSPMGVARRYTSASFGSAPCVRATTCAGTCSVHTRAMPWIVARWMIVVAHSATAALTLCPAQTVNVM